MYSAQKIEKKWQKIWARNAFKLWHALGQSKQKKFYVLDMFPYPSGDGLHIGHVVGYTASDIIARYHRMIGDNVLHPMGWDAFGLPAENYAIKKKIHPEIVVKNNVKNFRRQLQSVGFSYDWQREISTTDPEYYKWTQWIFLQLFKKGLAYEAEIPVNWCPSDKTVLANEEVIDGHCERCQSAVERKQLKQWILKITAYADRLLADLEGLDWPEKVKEMQKNWIGKSEGALIKFPISDAQSKIEVFTTRPDTLDGATYVVLAPEHSLINQLQSRIKNWSDVQQYTQQAKNKSERERQENKEKTGVELKGITAINPFNKEKIPVWVSDYVLIHYGAGAIMAVPQHDERDREFAKKFQLPILDRPLIPNDTVITKVNGQKKINYKLRDWIFSRQRYWGEPIPIIKCVQCGNVAVPEKDLPVTLPKVKNYEPTGNAESPLAAISKWVNVKCPQCHGPAQRETNTMPQWAGSCWYYLRYLDPKNKKAFVNPQVEKNWLPVDTYIGGVEHAVLHLLYARFWHKVLFDIGAVSTKEPFQKLVNQGLILGPDGQKMSKSRGNVINPDELVQKFGADSLRLYEMFMGPLEEAKPWDPKGIIGLERFLKRIYTYHEKVLAQPKKTVSTAGADKILHKTIKKVTDDIQQFRFNTAISALMIGLNEIEKTTIAQSQWEQFIKLIFPFAPHLAQELWSQLGKKGLLDYAAWPVYDSKLIQETEIDLIIQINGKVRGKIRVAKEITQAEAERIVLQDDRIKTMLSEKPKKVIFVSGRLINFVI
ncbi:MAG TPA: leucine--tRNA ligase [Candidatus Paceibacterota bacterium]